MLNDETIIRIVNIVKIRTEGVYNVIGHNRKVAAGNLFEKPCPSSVLKVFIVSEGTRLYYWPVSQIKYKMWTIKRNDTQDYIMPLRHKHD